MLNSILFADDTALIVENESYKIWTLFDSLCKRRKVKVQATKVQGQVYELSRSKIVAFVCSYNVGNECEK